MVRKWRALRICATAQAATAREARLRARVDLLDSRIADGTGGTIHVLHLQAKLDRVRVHLASLAKRLAELDAGCSGGSS